MLIYKLAFSVSIKNPKGAHISSIKHRITVKVKVNPNIQHHQTILLIVTNINDVTYYINIIIFFNFFNFYFYL